MKLSELVGQAYAKGEHSQLTSLHVMIWDLVGDAPPQKKSATLQ